MGTTFQPFSGPASKHFNENPNTYVCACLKSVSMQMCVGICVGLRYLQSMFSHISSRVRSNIQTWEYSIRTEMQSIFFCQNMCFYSFFQNWANIQAAQYLYSDSLKMWELVVYQSKYTFKH